MPLVKRNRQSRPRWRWCATLALLTLGCRAGDVTSPETGVQELGSGQVEDCPSCEHREPSSPERSAIAQAIYEIRRDINACKEVSDAAGLKYSAGRYKIYDENFTEGSVWWGYHRSSDHQVGVWSANFRPPGPYYGDWGVVNVDANELRETVIHENLHHVYPNADHAWIGEMINTCSPNE